jgi:ribosomal protein L29
MTAKLHALGSKGTRSYDGDIVAWATEQARLLRSGRWDRLDVEHIAEEIEGVGKSEQRELASRMAALLTHLLKWQFQRERRGASWETTIRTQRNSIARRLRRTPSLAASLADADWWADAWDDALAAATSETGIADLPRTCPWDPSLVLDPAWLPST